MLLRRVKLIFFFLQDTPKKAGAASDSDSKDSHVCNPMIKTQIKIFPIPSFSKLFKAFLSTLVPLTRNLYRNSACKTPCSTGLGKNLCKFLVQTISLQQGMNRKVSLCRELGPWVGIRFFCKASVKALGRTSKHFCENS